MKLVQEVSRLFKLYTPAYSRSVVEKNLKMSGIEEMTDEKKIAPLLHYIESLQKHKEYLDFFEIGVVRDQRKKIENVAKYVGLAIRDFSQEDMDAKLTTSEKSNAEKTEGEDISKHS